jgi:hypothetical protein
MLWRSAGLEGAYNSSARTRACAVTMQRQKKNYRTSSYCEEHFWSPHSGKPSGWCKDNWIHWVPSYIRLPDFIGDSFLRFNEGVAYRHVFFRTLRNNHSGYFNVIRHYTRSVIVKVSWRDMTPERRKCTVRKAPQKTTIARQRLARHVSAARYRLVEIKVLLQN